MTKDITNFSDIWYLFDSKYIRRVLAIDSLNVSRHRVQTFEALPKDTLEAQCKTSLATFKFRIMPPAIKALDRFRRLKMLRSTPYESFDMEIKEAYHSKLQRRTYVSEDTLWAEDMARRNRKQRLEKEMTNEKRSLRRAYLYLH